MPLKKEEEIAIMENIVKSFEADSFALSKRLEIAKKIGDVEMLPVLKEKASKMLMSLDAAEEELKSYSEKEGKTAE